MKELVLELVPRGNTNEFEYQTSVVLRNNEPVPGAVGVESELVGQRVGSGDGNWSDTVHVPGNTSVRVALRSLRPLDRVTLHPHIALNRNKINLWVENGRPQIVQGLALPYVEEIDWVPVDDDTSIIVDDLSEGFTIVDGRKHHPPHLKPSIFAYFFGPDLFNPNLNKGLPSLRGAFEFARRGEFSLWFRDREDTSHGKYYRTYASNFMGSNEAQPQFVAKLPAVARWRLDFHVPSTRNETYPFPYDNPFAYGSYANGWRPLGVHRLEIDIGNATEMVELDLSVEPIGWNEVGIFETTSYEVRVTIVEVTDGVAIADAIRWTPVE